MGQSHRDEPSRRRSRRVLFVLMAVLIPVVIVAGTAVVVLAGAAATTRQVGRPSAPRLSTTTAPLLPLAVTDTTPANGAAGIDTSTPLTVNMSAPLAPASPMPVLTPAVPGHWFRPSPTALVFVASGPFVPGTHETLTVPAGSDGLVGVSGQHLAFPYVAHFSFTPGSVSRLQQLLAQLGYMPLTFTAAGNPPVLPQQEADPQPGTFSWRWADVGEALAPSWTPGTDNVITKGAVMDFEAQHGLVTDGIAGSQVWTALLNADSAQATDPQPYGYVYVSQSLPESATVFQNGTAAYTTPVNTGVPGATTADGTFPVYVRYQVTTMRGTNPDGSTYVDPGIPWVSYFNGGDALHGFVRAQYGFPQSDGCVEMPPDNAQVVWPMTPIGTLVTVAN